MSAVKVIDGYADGSFNPTATLTRGAAAKIICNLILGPTTASALVADAAPYKDVPANHTFAGYIAYCQKTGIISGYADGTFKPANSLTGYAFMKMLLGALGYKADQRGLHRRQLVHQRCQARSEHRPERRSGGRLQRRQGCQP